MLICVFVLSSAAKPLATLFDSGLQPANRVVFTMHAHSLDSRHFNLLILIASLSVLSFDLRSAMVRPVRIDGQEHHIDGTLSIDFRFIHEN